MNSINLLGRRWPIAICALTLLAGAVLGQEGRKAISQPTPIYPQLARKSGLSGTVKVQVVIATDGTVKDVKVVGGHPLFIDSTLDALKKWKYAPSGSETTTLLEFNFHPWSGKQALGEKCQRSFLFHQRRRPNRTFLQS